MVTRQDIYPKEDLVILRNAINTSKRRLTGTPYKCISIKEAIAYIGYPDVEIDTKA